MIIVDDVVSSGIGVRVLTDEMGKRGVEVKGVISLGQTDKRFVSESDLERVANKLSQYNNNKEQIYNNLKIVFGDSLKHELNQIERALSNPEYGGEIYEYITKESRIRRSRTEVVGLEQAERTKTGDNRREIVGAVRLPEQKKGRKNTEVNEQENEYNQFTL